MIGKLLGKAFDIASEAIDEADARRELRDLRHAYAERGKRLEAALIKIDQLELEMEAYKLAERERERRH